MDDDEEVEKEKEREKGKAEKPIQDYGIVPPSWSKEPKSPKSKL